LPLNFKTLRLFRSKNMFSKLWNPLKNFTRLFSNGQNVLAIRDSRLGYHVHQISGVKWQSGTLRKLKEIPLLINFVSLIIVHYSCCSSLAAPDTCRKIICFPDLTLKSLVKFFNGFHSFENIFLLRNNLNVLKFKGNH
jgi:hypothetical protein